MAGSPSGLSAFLLAITMGDITRGHNYADTGSGAAVNAANLHSLVDDAVIKASAVVTAHILDGAVSTDKLAADAVDGTKIADDAIDSEHVAAGAIDLEHFAGPARPITYDFAIHRRGLVPAPTNGEKEYVLTATGWQSIDSQVSALIDTDVAAAVLTSPGIAFHNHANFT
jgi:hypothetical protein